MILIDTNVYSASLRGDETVVAVLRKSDQILIPTVVIGELRSGFLGGSMNEKNNAILERFLADSKVQLPSITLQTTEIYGQLVNQCKRLGRVLSNNDVWIASIAKENNCRFVTFDKDFEVFSEFFGEKLLILEI